VFMTDGGSENTNSKIESFINFVNGNITHKVAQRDVVFSNAMIEAFNKVLKHQFLIPEHPKSKKQLRILLSFAIETYNNHKPQLNLEGNTTNEMFLNNTINLISYQAAFKSHKKFRIEANKQYNCKSCL